MPEPRRYRSPAYLGIKIGFDYNFYLKKSEKGGVGYDILGKAIKELESERYIRVWK